MFSEYNIAKLKNPGGGGGGGWGQTRTPFDCGCNKITCNLYYYVFETNVLFSPIVIHNKRELTPKAWNCCLMWLFIST